MGREVCRAVLGDPELELAAAVDPPLAGIDLRQVIGSDVPGLQVGASVDDLERSEVQVAVDFSVADVAIETMRWCAAHAVHAVVGTTGIPQDTVSELREVFASATSNCLIAPNFAIGAVLMMRLAELAAPYMDGAEIIELHHDGKLDAPSGTSLDSAKRMEQARVEAGKTRWPADRTRNEIAKGSRGGEGPGGVRMHSVRLPGLVAHQEIVFGAVGQSLTIRHDAYDRTSFMPGVLLAVKAVADLRGLTVGLDSVLGF